MADKADNLSGYAEGNLNLWLSRNGIDQKKVPEYRSAFAQSYLALRGIMSEESART